MKRVVKNIVMWLAICAAWSCGSEKVVALSGEWSIEKVNGRESVGEIAPSIGFNPADSTIYGNSSCNRFFGRMLFVDGDASAISFSDMGSTRMLCQNAPMEEEILAAIGSVTSFRYTEEGDVELLSDDDTVVLLISPEESAK